MLRAWHLAGTEVLGGPALPWQAVASGAFVRGSGMAGHFGVHPRPGSLPFVSASHPMRHKVRKSLRPQPSTAPPRVAPSHSLMSAPAAVVWRDQQGSGAWGCLPWARGWFLGVTLIWAWSGPSVADATVQKGSGRPGQVGALRHREMEETRRRVQSALMVLVVSPGQLFAWL